MNSNTTNNMTTVAPATAVLDGPTFDERSEEKWEREI